MKKIRTSILLLTLLFVATLAKANALYPVYIEEKINNSTNIIEGKVVSKTSFWNAAHTVIFTSNKIKVYKIFKGGMTDDYIEVLTQGGTVGDISLEVSDLLSLDNEEVGIFFLFPNSLNIKSPITNNVLMDVYSSSQGCFVYDIANKKAIAPFVNYNNITGTLYTELQIKTGNSIIIKDPSFNLGSTAIGVGVLATPIVASFSPTTIYAGASLDPANNVLTIDGSGFGAATGSAAVLFSDGNIGGTTPTYVVNATDVSIVQWTNSQIKVKVPTRAATGFFSVRESSGLLGQSSGYLDIYYSVLQVSGTGKEMNLMNQNGSGGYTVYFSNNAAGGGIDLNGSSTKATVQRALTTWAEIVGMNWPEGGATSSQSLNNDAENLVMYDNTNSGTTPLSAGVLAVCYSYSGLCSGKEAQKTAFDVIIRSGASSGSANFTAGPCSPSSSQIDLETVLLHEFGHAIGLGHINDGTQGSYPNNNTGKLMHYAVDFGVKRTTPDGSAYKGSLYVCNQQNNSYGTCLYPSEMTQLSYTTVVNDDCPASFSSVATNIGTIVAFDLVHATSNALVDPQFTEVKCTSVGTAVTNNQYYALKTLTSGVINITVSGYATTPAAANSCTTKGVELALYEVPSCPIGDNFPSPIACRTFSADGNLTSITGLQANTDYLLFVDGIANTKAVFNLTFNGSALPLKLSTFNGEVFNNYNLLNWTAQMASETQKIFVEKSSNGTNFETIGTLMGDVVFKTNNSFRDNSPFVGNNYYRLCVVSANGEKEYSNTIVLKRKDKLLFSVSPNPANNFISVSLSAETVGLFQVNIFDILGKRVASSGFSGNNFTSSRINLQQLTNGIYQVVVLDAQQKKVASQTIVIEK